jgi:hypothetical protein
MVLKILYTQRSTPTVFEPFFCGLVSADVELPGFKGDIAKVFLFRISPYLPVIFMYPVLAIPLNVF